MNCGGCGKPDGGALHSIVVDVQDSQGRVLRELRFEEARFCSPECVLAMVAQAAQDGQFPSSTTSATVVSMKFDGEYEADED